MRSVPRASLAVWIAAVGLWSLFLAFLGLHLVTPSDGARLAPGEPQSVGQGLRLAPLVPGAMQPGDLLLAVNGQSVHSLAGELSNPGQAGARLAFGQSVTYTIERAGRRLDLPVTLGAYPLGAVLAVNWGSIATALIFQVATAIVFLKRPAEPVARAMFLAAAAMVAATSWSLGLQASDVVGGLGFWLYSLTTIFAYLLLWSGALHATLLFPTPWPPLARHRWILAVLYAVPYVILALVSWLARAPDALAWEQQMGAVTGYVQGAYSLLAVAAVVRGYRSARDPVSRAQVRWVTTAFAIAFFSGLAFGVIPELVLGYTLLSWDVLALIGLVVPLAIGVAILRYRLFDIDVSLTRALVYGALTLWVVSVYVLIVGGLGALFQASSSFGLSLLATGLIAVCFQPVRDRLQRAANRLLYGERDDPYAVLSGLGRRLEATLAPEDVLPALVETIAQTLKLPYVAVALPAAGEREPQIAAAYGLPPAGTGAQPARLPLTYQAERMGDLLVAPRGPGESFTPAELNLLAAIAHQAGVAAHAVRLTADLQHSRERLVSALEDERRRLRRDLHDGLGPQLASQTLTLTAARQLLHQDPAQAEALLAEAIKHAQAAVADIRRVVYDLRPPALDDLGLAGALRAQAAAYGASRVAFTVNVPEVLPPLPAAVEVATYRIAQEALTNVVKHAGAGHCTLTLALDGAVSLEVVDDGCGLPAERRAGVGLGSMRERAAEVGGLCTIEPGPAGGTRVRARLPLG